MIEKTTHVPIVVSDQDRALDFYTRVLGFEKHQDYQQEGRPRWLTVAPHGQDVEFILVKGRYTVDPRPPADAESGGNHHVLSTNDCHADFAALTARGLKFKDPAPNEAPYGITAYFTDPDGNHFALLESKRPANGRSGETS
jgi:catechol 2,3-dioxygenase-like lactoylglutathione lyase family enzyme